MRYQSPEQIHLDNIYAATATLWLSKTVAERIVGGEKRLLDLIAGGEIDADKPSGSRNGKWRCNAAQVLRHCRLARRKEKRNLKTNQTDTI